MDAVAGTQTGWATQGLRLLCRLPRFPEKMSFVKVTFLGHFKGLWSKGVSLCLSLPGLEQGPLPPEAADLGTGRSRAAELSSTSSAAGNSAHINLAPVKASLCKTGLNLKASGKRSPGSALHNISPAARGGMREESSHSQPRHPRDKCPLGMLRLPTAQRRRNESTAGGETQAHITVHCPPRGTYLVAEIDEQHGLQKAD